MRTQSRKDSISNRDDIFTDSTRRTVDLEFQHRLRVSPRNELVWGTGVRNSDSRIDTHRRTIKFGDRAHPGQAGGDDRHAAEAAGLTLSAKLATIVESAKGP